MKLIVVDRSKMETFRRLSDKFADDLNVHVVWDRRRKQGRTRQENHYPDRRIADRRKLKKDWNGRKTVSRTRLRPFCCISHLQAANGLKFGLC